MVDKFNEYPILAIDPGTTDSAWVIGDKDGILLKGYYTNGTMLQHIHWFRSENPDSPIFIESITSYGMPLGQETIDTCVWIGKFHVHNAHLLSRRSIKLHHCGTSNAKDKNIRQVLIDKYGKPSTKANPNKFHGGGYRQKVSTHMWSAMAVYTYVLERLETGEDLNIYELPGC